MEEKRSLQEIALQFVSSKSEKDFGALYTRLRPGLLKHAYYYLKDWDYAEDMVSITLSRAFQWVEKYNPKWSFSTWVYSICRNECLIELRRRNVTRSLDSMMENGSAMNPLRSEDWMALPEYGETEVQPDETELLEKIHDTAKTLPERFFDVFHDREVLRLKYDQIAEKRGLKMNTVRSRLHTAKKLIRLKLNTAE